VSEERGREPSAAPADAATAALATLVEHESVVAREWLGAVVAAQPLDQIASLPLADLAGDAGFLCRALVGTPGCAGHGARALRRAGRGDAARTVRAGELLRGVCWGVLRRAGGGEDVADSLAAACAELAAAALSLDPSAADGPAAPAGADEFVIFDEFAGRRVAAGAAPAAREEEPPVRARDVRSGEDPRWGARIRAQMDRFRAEGLPFSLLLAELIDLQLLSAVESPPAMERLAAAVGDAIAYELSPHDGEPVGERPGRWWIVSADQDRAAARRSAERLARAARTVVDGRGDRVELVVGVAVSPPDGQEFAELAAQADVAMFAARSQARADGR